MTDSPAPEMILHVGAPKCGSSALQTALSATPDLCGADGTRYRYTTAYSIGGSWRVNEGWRLRLGARATPYGYGSWPNLGPRVDTDAVMAALVATHARGRRRGHVPIVSNEGWINHHVAFARMLADMGHPPVDVVVFLRPVIDWVNAAFWQWGVWHTNTLDAWMARGNMRYSFAEDIAAWAQIPNVRLRVRGQRPDVVAKFADLYDHSLEAERTSNAASSAILTGVLLRNRRFRPDGHSGAIEFIVQRWCPPIPGRKLWAVLARHVHALRPQRLAALETLEAVLDPADMADILDDPRWRREALYHPEIAAGVTPLNDPALFRPLYDALVAGVDAAAQAAGVPPPDLPPRPAAGSDIATWDNAICPVLETLSQLDARVRSAVVPRWQRPLLNVAERLRRE